MSNLSLSETSALLDSKSEEWTRKRKKTFIVYCILMCCLGMEYSIIAPSLWFYIDHITKGEDVLWYYSLGFSAYYISPILTGFLVTWFVDKTRLSKQVMIVLICAEIIGNVLYSIHLSPWLPFAGRLIQGLGDVNLSIMTGEMARSYHRKELTSKFSTIGACYCVSFVAAPALNIIFDYIDFWVSDFHVFFGNLPGLFMGILFTVSLILVILTTSNLSKEYDLKKEEENNTFERDKSSSNPLQLLLYKDFVLIILLCFLMSFTMAAFLDVAMPVLTSTAFEYTTRETSILFIADALIFIVLSKVIGYLSKKYKDITMLQSGLLVFIASILLLLLFSVLPPEVNIFREIVYICHVLTFGLCWGLEHLLAKSLLSKITPSQHQAFSEGVRRTMSGIAYLTSSFVTTYFISKIWILCIAVVMVTIIICVLLCKRRMDLLREVPLF